MLRTDKERPQVDVAQKVTEHILNVRVQKNVSRTSRYWTLRNTKGQIQQRNTGFCRYLVSQRMADFVDRHKSGVGEEILDEFSSLNIEEDEHEFADAVAVAPEISEAVDVDSAAFTYEKSLEKALEAKEEGNNYFRNKEYDDALESYSRAITYCPEDDANKENLATFYGNRAAAYASLEEYDLVVEDCTAALAIKPDYVKVLARRMLANEKLEKYEDALTGNLNHLYYIF